MGGIGARGSTTLMLHWEADLRSGEGIGAEEEEKGGERRGRVTMPILHCPVIFP